MKIKLNNLILSDLNTEMQLEMKDDFISGGNTLEDLDHNLIYQKYIEILPDLEKLSEEYLATHKEDIEKIKEKYKGIEFPENIEINVYFCQRNYYNEMIGGIYNNHNSLGVAIYYNGEGLTKSEETYFADQFDLIVSIPSHEEILKNESNINDYLFRELNTLTHELNHHLLFLRSSAGMTPNDVDLWNSIDEDNSDFNFEKDVNDCILSSDLVISENFNKLSISEKTRNDEMELYVEEEGYNMLYSIKTLNIKELSKKISFLTNKEVLKKKEIRIY